MKKKFIIVFLCFVILVVGFIWGKTSKENNTEVQKENNIEISSIDDLYAAVSTEITPLTNLPEEYSIYNAVEDGYLVVMRNSYNDEVKDEFMNLYNKKEKAFTRVAQLTDEGDLILYDVVYLPEKDKIYIITDYTRDKFSTEEDRKISYKEYDKVATSYKGKKCWIAYNGDLSEENDKNVFYILSI